MASTGGPEESYRPSGYNRYFFDAFLPPYEQTAALAGMRFLPPLLVHGAHRLGDEEIDAQVQTYTQRLEQLPRLAGNRRAGALRALRRARRRAPRGGKLTMEHDTSWLQTSLVYLGAAVVAVPLSRLLGLGSIIGYLAAGVAIGPWGLGLVTDAITILHVAEFGVVLMMFLVGLELEPKRLWAMRRPIFGWGSVQLFGSAALLTGIAVACGVDWRIALVASLGLADSSTATGLGIAAERNLLPTNAGQRMLGVLLLQDVAAIPILALIPLLALTGAHADGNGWITAAKAVGVIAAIVFGGRLLLRPALRWIARSDSPEIFTAASLLLVVATAALMHSVGLSMALGAFLAGVLLAESEYRRELETDIEPFKGLLLGLFFIAVGMTIDFAVIAAQPGLVAAIVLGLLVVKALVLWGIARATGIAAGERPLFVVLLAQGGEMGFVIFQAAAGAACDRRTDLVAADGGGDAVDAGGAAAADRRRPAGRALRRGADPQAGRDRRPPGCAGDHRRLRPLRADRRPAAVGQRPAGHGAGPRRRADRNACAASAGRPSTATRPGWTCCAWPAPAARACSCWPSTTSSRAWRWPSWCASISRR